MTSALDWPRVFGKELSPSLDSRLSRLFEPAPVAANGDCILMANGASFPVVGSVPYFAADVGYAESFSYQWEHFPGTQLDRQGTRLAELDLISKTGLQEQDVAGKLVLDAGVGIGRHSEVLARWGATVVAVDLSRSVHVARANLARFGNAVVMKADILDLPFRPGSFDFVISIGVIHHTPLPQQCVAHLSRLLRPGGELAVWVYSSRHARRSEWRPLTSILPKPMFKDWCEWISPIARAARGEAWMEALLRQIPFSTHHDSEERTVLALFDGYTPKYQWTCTSNELLSWLREAGLLDVRSSEIHSSGRGRRPA
jgi:SAM-dependent methyltransferase